MCNKRSGCLRQQPIDQRQYLGDIFPMDSPTTITAPNSAPCSNDENPRVKFLCSFSGTILPRPQDGKLRYVGGETRIVGVPRDITYEEFMKRMRELFDGATVMKYQQPDEDLDALVSVVNDDDVMNLMEEYDKLDSGDGITKLRIFLFSHSDQDVAPHFVDGNEGDCEKRYVDALNNLNDSSDCGRQQQLNDSPRMRVLDEVHVAEQLFNMGLNGSSAYSHRHYDMFDSHLVVPQLRLGQHQQPIPHRYELDAHWNPAYYSPRHTGLHDPRSFSDFPSSPSSARYRLPFGELPDNRTPEEYGRQPVIQQFPLDHQLHSIGNVPTGAVTCDNTGFPGNILHAANGIEGISGYSEHFQPNFQRNQSHSEKSNTGNGFQQIGIPCSDCPPHHEQGWMSHNHFNTHSEEMKPHASVAARMNDYYPGNGSRINISMGHGNTTDGHTQSSVSTPNDPWYVHLGELGNETLNQAVVSGPHIPSHGIEERPVVNGNLPYGYGTENIYQIKHAPLPSPHASWRNVQNPGHVYEFPATVPQASSAENPGYLRNTLDDSPWFPIGVNNHMSRIDSSAKATGFDESDIPECHQGHALELNPNSLKQISIKPGRLEEKIFMHGGEKVEAHVKEVEVKKAAIDVAEEVKEKVERHADSSPPSSSISKEASPSEVECTNAHGDVEVDSDTENIDKSKIEPTKAEEEAIERGLQTIKSDDLEEIRELGSGTYGSVFHGKWRGSDVAIKRIKASCFAGKPSERERLIADFWKEALILSSLHHPNVVSFYGIVRDGPDGSLATVTEFMINGSLKQFLRKKDRTIDRRKRLIIGMDAAFGMEYLHGKNIVHFDLKCENLLVNMRDPQRPVCKIGDLGLSKVKQRTLVSGGVRGTLPWMAPELLSGKSNMVSEKIDVYSFGVVMWELLTGDEPYVDMHCASIIGGIVNNTLRPEVPTWCDPEWKSLMECCWASSPADRPSFSEISQRLRTMASAMNLK